MKKNILIVLLCIFVLGLSSYIVYDKFIDKKPETNEKESNNEEVSTLYTQDEILKEITSYLGLGTLVNKKSLSEMTNQEKLRMLISLYNGDDKYETFSQTKLEEIHKRSVIKNLDVTYEGLSDYFGTFVWNTTRLGYEYNADAKTFTYTGNLGHGAVAKGNITHSEVVSYNREGNTYKIECRYIFINSSGDGPSDVDLYLNANDAIEGKNVWKHIPVGDDYTTHEKEYIEAHYKEVADKLPIYKYTFKVEDDVLVITDFSVKEA